MTNLTTLITIGSFFILLGIALAIVGILVQRATKQRRIDNTPKRYIKTLYHDNIRNLGLRGWHEKTLDCFYKNKPIYFTTNKWYPANIEWRESLEEYRVSAGCFHGDISEFYTRIHAKPRCPEAMTYYMAKYQEFLDFINLNSPVRPQTADNLSVGSATTSGSGPQNTDA